MTPIELKDGEVPPDDADWAALYLGADGGCRLVIYRLGGQSSATPVTGGFDETLAAATAWAIANAALVYVKRL